jgi:hypothetical protein
MSRRPAAGQLDLLTVPEEAPRPTRLSAGGLKPTAPRRQADALAAGRALLLRVLGSQPTTRRALAKTDLAQMVTELRSLARWGGVARHAPETLTAVADAVAPLAALLARTHARHAHDMERDPAYLDARAAALAAFSAAGVE